MFEVNVLLKITQIPGRKSTGVDDNSKSERLIRLIRKQKKILLLYSI